LVSEAACEPKNSSKSCLRHVILASNEGAETGENRPVKDMGNFKDNSDAAFGTTLELVSAFIEASKKFIFVFFL
jgi:hypothetical protein